jgi:hypothetical protein
MKSETGAVADRLPARGVGDSVITEWRDLILAKFEPESDDGEFL